MIGLSHDSTDRMHLLEEAKQTFEEIDADGSGTLTYEEIFHALEERGTVWAWV